MQEIIPTQSGDEAIVVSKSEYEQLKQGVQQIMLAWLDEQATQEKLQRCADFAISVLHNDLTLRVPRLPEQRRTDLRHGETSGTIDLAQQSRKSFIASFQGSPAVGRQK